MADINYGSSKEGYQDALAAWQTQEAALTKATKATEANVAARRSATPVIQAQADVLDLSTAALGRETEVLRANTTAWRAAAKARADANAVAQAGLVGIPAQGSVYAPTRVGPLGVAPQVEAQRYAEVTAAERAAASLQPAAGARQIAQQRDDAAVAEARRERTRIAANEVLEARRNTPLYHGTNTPPAEVAASGLPQGAYLAASQRDAEDYGRYVYEVRRKGLALAQDRSDLISDFYQVPGGVPPTNIRPLGLSAGRGADAGLGAFGPSAATAEQQKLLRAQQDIQLSLAGTDGQLAKTGSAWRLYTAETAAASQALTRHGALSAEFIQALARGEVTLAEFGSQLTTTIGKFAGWAVAGGLVYGAFEALKQVVRGATDTATGVAQLERAQIPGFNKADAEEGFRRTAARTNVPISEVANAQFFAARAGFNKSLPETQSAGETAVLAFKLDEVPVQDAARSLGTVAKAFGLNATQIRGVFNELDVGQLKFNARLQQTLPYLGRSAAAIQTSGGSVKDLVAQIVEVTGAVPGGGGGGGSGSAATFFTRLPGNLRRPAAQDILRGYGFDTGVGSTDLIKQLQEAARTGRTPSGAVDDANARYRQAEAISGGPALAGRYGIQAINAGLEDKAKRVEQELAKAQGGSGEDLKARLSQFNEQAASIGHTFERVGSELGAAGITSAGEDFVSIIKKMGEATAFVVQPLGQIGSIFSSLPTALQDIIVAGGGLAVASRFGGFNLLGSNADKDYTRAASRTTSEALARQRSIVERRANDLYAGGEREVQVAAEKERFKNSYGAALAPGALAYDDPVRLRLQAQGQEIDQRLLAARQANVATNQALLTSREQLLKLEADQTTLDDRRLQVGQKASILRSRGVIVSPGGIGYNGPLIGPSGESLGTAESARARFIAGPAGSGKLTEDLNRTAIGVSESGAALQGSVLGVARVNTEGAAGLKEALSISGAQMREGGVAVAEAMKQSALLIATAGRSGALSLGEARSVGRGGIGDIVGGAALGAGSIGSRIGANALKGLGYAFIGSAIAELGGEAVAGITGSKRAGSVFSGIGSDVALGAGAGALFGPEGAAVGAGVGLVGGLLDQSGIFGGGTKTEAAKTARLKAEQQALKEGVTANQASIAGQAAEFGTQLEAAVKDESESAVKAREKVGQIIKNLGATVTSFGPGTSQAGEAEELIASTIAEAWFRQFEVKPEQRGKASEIYREALQNASKAGDQTLQVNLPFATSPAQRQQVTNQALAPLQKVRSEVSERTALLVEELHNAEAKQRSDQAKLPPSIGSRRLVSGLDGELSGLGNERITVAPGGGLAAALAADAAAVRALRKKVSEATGPAKQAFEREVGLLELGKIEPGVKEDQSAIKAHYEKLSAEAGNDPARKRELDRQQRQAEQQAASKYFNIPGPGGKKFREEEDKHAGESAKARQEATAEQLKEREQQGARELAQLPANASPQQVAALKSSIAAAKLAIIKRNANHAFSNEQLTSAEVELLEANKARQQAVESEASQLASLRGQIREAGDAGNAIAQANDAAATAGELLALAKTPAERLQAQLQLAQAANQLQQAQEQHIADLGSLAESREPNQLDKDRTKITTLNKQLAKAKGPDERTKLTAQRNEAIRKLAEDAIGEQENVIDYESKTHEIGPAQLVDKYRQLLTKAEKEHASAREIRAIKLKIFEAETGQTTDLIVGDIKLPTYYGARTLTAKAQAASGLPGGGGGGGYGYSAIPAPITHNTTHNNVSIIVPGSHNPEETAKHVYREFRQATKGHRRTAGLVR